MASVAISHRILCCALVVALSEKKEVPFSMAIGNEELMHECFPKHFRMGSARMKYGTEREEGKTRCVSMERSKAGTKRLSPKGLKYSSGLSSPGVATP